MPNWSILETMFDLDSAINKAVRACRGNFNGDAAVEKAVAELLSEKTPVARKKRVLVCLGVLTGEVFIGPQTLHLDIVGVCNINCIYCRDHSPWVTEREKWREMEMPFDLIERLIDEGVKMGASCVPFLGAGEPFMHSRYFDIIKKVKSTPLEFEVFTNGLLFDDAAIELFHDAKAGRLHFSISAANNEVYKKYRPNLGGEPYTKIEKTIEKLVKARKSGLRLIVVHVLNSLNFHQVIPMMERAVALGVDEVQYKLTEMGDFNRSLLLTPEMLHSIELELKHAKHLAGKAGVDLHDNIDFQLEQVSAQTGNYAEGLFDKIGCHIGWDLVRIRRDGEISFCCALKFMDRIDKKSLSEYWHGELMTKARIAARGFPVGKNLEYAPGQKLRDKQCDYCYNYISNIHSHKELGDLGLISPVDKNR